MLSRHRIAGRRLQGVLSMQAQASARQVGKQIAAGDEKIARNGVVGRRPLSTTPTRSLDESDAKHSLDPRLRDLGRQISDDYAQLRERYDTPKHPLVLAHGLLGFSELKIWGDTFPLPAIQYWRGIKDALVSNAKANLAKRTLDETSGSSSPTPSVIACTVPPSGSIASRAEHLAADIAQQLRIEGSAGGGKETTINIIAHSMGGLDARFLISRLKPKGLRVASLTTIATPHRGSCIVDLLMDTAEGVSATADANVNANANADAEKGGEQKETAEKAAEKVAAASSSPASTRLHSLVTAALFRAGLESAAFSQLSREYLEREFNPNTPNDPSVRYFSYGATIVSARQPVSEGRSQEEPGPEAGPGLLSPFRLTWAELKREEGANDGLVSVQSSRWGEYKGTLVGASHMDLINWTNRIGWTVKSWLGFKRNFNAVAFYLDIADMLAKEGL